jgi:hypothetical protein
MDRSVYQARWLLVPPFALWFGFMILGLALG